MLQPQQRPLGAGYRALHCTLASRARMLPTAAPAAPGLSRRRWRVTGQRSAIGQLTSPARCPAAAVRGLSAWSVPTARPVRPVRPALRGPTAQPGPRGRPEAPARPAGRGSAGRRGRWGRTAPMARTAAGEWPGRRAWWGCLGCQV